MFQSVPHPEDLRTLKYIVDHIFFPCRLPDGDDHSVANDQALAHSIVSAAHLFGNRLSPEESQWRSITRMLDNLNDAVQYEAMHKNRTIAQLEAMVIGDVRAFFVRAQNAAVVFRKVADGVIVESFEVSPKTEDVMASQGKLICSYPGPAIRIPLSLFGQEDFISQLVNFLVHMNHDVLDAAPTTRKAQSTVIETRDTTHPRYITELLTGILRSVGFPADIPRINKRIGDDVVWDNSELPWRRSPLWLLIRVVLQTSLCRSALGNSTYKNFILFFMSSIAKETICADLSNDLLHAMTTKISRRLRKLGTSAPQWLSSVALEACTLLQSTLEKRWKQVQDTQRSSPFQAPSQLDLARDVHLSLLRSGDYIRNSLEKQIINTPCSLFGPSHRSRGFLDDFLSSDGSFFDDAYRAEPQVALYDVERAVEGGIDNWVGQVVNNDDACVKLEILANKYSSGARETYGSNPELLSGMLLTVIELWIALDKIAIKEIHILAEYSPEVPLRILEDLLICRRKSLDRLRIAHKYISCRHSSANRGWSVFSGTYTKDSFSVRFYRDSSNLRYLKDRIEEKAQSEVNQKIDELEKDNARHAELQRTAAQQSHECGTNKYGYQYRDRYCSKCYTEREYQSMKIDIHEWPLPADQLEAEAVVFELDCPVSFNMWRTATFHLLVDICTPTFDRTNPYIELSDYAALSPYFVHHDRSRITLASNTKPFTVAHYKQTSIPATKDLVCVNNGLKFYGFDRHARTLVSSVLGGESVSKYCTYVLESGCYENLKGYMDATYHTSNDVVANQACCHKDLSLHEFAAFGHLRSGGLIQWLNVLRELRGRSLSFHRYEVHFLLAQVVSQVGPFVDTKWTWHEEIQRPKFCYAFLEELEKLFRNVEGNWLELITMDTVSFLLRRLVSSSPNEAVTQRALCLLRNVRDKVFSWTRELTKKFEETPEAEEFHGYVRDTAAVCRSTFDVDPELISKLLHTEQDVKTLLSSAILVNNHTPANVSSIPYYSRLLLDRNRRLSLTLEKILRDAIQADWGDRGVDLAVSSVWPDYRSYSRWIVLPYPNSRWIRCITAATENNVSQEIHLNLLDGLLLIDGKPLGRLPSDIQRHPLYDSIFGDQVLDVIPSNLPGMDYSTRGRIFDHQVHFSLRGKRLIIRAKQLDSPTLELIPPEIFEGDLPAVLIEGHCHWLDLSTSILEIRPFNSLWKSSEENWSIRYTPERCDMRRGDELLVDIRSESWKMIASVLKPLDEARNLLVSVVPTACDKSPSSWQLSTTLPRYGLSFYVDEDKNLQSRDIRGMVYDENQSAGTLFGLVNRLVLRPKCRDGINAGELEFRCVLIPDGEVTFMTQDHHVYVEIGTPRSALQQITYQTYRIDTDLGCLSGNASLTSRLYSVYLHALTSGCGADPLTGRSGTEEALTILRSANCWSMMRLTPRDAELLNLIASICPPRTWYPVHLRCMQTVKWRALPVYSQHHDLYLVSKALKEHYERVQMFHEDHTESLMTFPSLEEHLLERSATRAVYLYQFDLSETFEHRLDNIYPARDLVTNTSEGEQRAYAAAAVVYHREADSTTNKDVILNMLKMWSSVKSEAELSLQYDSSWLAPNPQLVWLHIYNLLRKSDDRKWDQLLFSLPAMAYASQNLKDLVPAFVAFAKKNSRFPQENPPYYQSYELSKGYEPSSSALREFLFDSAHRFEDCPESSESSRRGESEQELQSRRYKMYMDRRSRDVEATVRQLSNAWPCETAPRCPLSSSYDIAQLTSKVQSLFSSCYRNLKLKEHLTRVQNILNSTYSHTSPSSPAQYSFDPSKDVSSRAPWWFTTKQLLSRSAPSLPTRSKLELSAAEVENASEPLPGPALLLQMISTAKEKSENPFQQRYISALQTSADCFRDELESLGAQKYKILPSIEALNSYYAQCRHHYVTGLERLKEYLSPTTRCEQALQQSGQWPRVTAHVLFRCLASNSPIVLSDDWKKCLTGLAFLALDLQRARRLLRLGLENLSDELRRELENEGCDGWNAEDCPDWLLIQLQCNVLVRGVQAEVAKQMITPSSGSNTAMQLNMGEGKSSVIVPIVVVHLANGDQLVRVIVPKALTAQMFYLLVERLGGLVNRRVYFLPFSRSLNVNRKEVVALHNMLLECMKEGGVLVVQPEHILSLRLVSVEKQLPSENGDWLAGSLRELQRWLHSRSRDILDESDEILHVRYQLVYTIGLQQQMEYSPDRWTTTQQVLCLVSKYAPALRERYPSEVEYESGPSGPFFHLRILRENAGRQLSLWIVQDILDGRLPNINLGQLRPTLRNAIRNFIFMEHVSDSDVQATREYANQTPLWAGLLLLRGLIANGIILFVFQERRWRVDYGLAPERTMLAVPYRAKDVPAQRAEFGHPDVAIILTCLSYYYGGLSQEQLQLSFEMLLKQDDPTLEYEIWVRDCAKVPEFLQTVRGVNIKSSDQWQKYLFPLFTKNRATVDFYLSNVVFPKEAKEFPRKLSCSGWDLAERKNRLLTGFSGTNDGRYLLPLHITQRDPDHQRGTNARVLSYLLQPENNYYQCMSHENGARRTTHEFLEMLSKQEPKIRVLLDVGAQMLDLENYQLAKKWLEVSSDVSAAIYFNEKDELTVCKRDGSTQPFISSPYSQQLDKCVIYLDDAHTRGTDIKFPRGFRAAVTLGPKVTKDRLAQGCMRMRKLGKGHSIMFFAPLEVDRRIRAVAGKDYEGVIDTMDILQWTIRETCVEIQQRFPHWAQQGMDHTARYGAWIGFCEGELSAEALSSKWLQPEAKKLEELYLQNASRPTWSSVPEINTRCDELGVSSPRDVSMDEEQEREVVHEEERERQVERPPKVDPARHSIHPDVVALVNTGNVLTSSNAFQPVFGTLYATKAVAPEPHVWSSSVLATTDFTKTVQKSEELDEYLRPVQWVLSARMNGGPALVLLSPFEVNYLLPLIRSSIKVNLHTYTPRITRSMKPCDDLDLYSVPTSAVSAPVSLVDQLNVFAGQLYLKDYETYVRLCRFLCVYARDLQGEESIEVGCDGFLAPRSRPMGLRLSLSDTFQRSPIASLRELISIRRKGMRFGPTHMGQLVDGRLLSQNDFDNHDDDVESR